MEIKPIKTENDYNKALQRLELIFDAHPNSKQGDEAEILSLLIDNYENKHYPIDSPDPIEAIKKVIGKLRNEDERKEVISCLKKQVWDRFDGEIYALADIQMPKTFKAAGKNEYDNVYLIDNDKNKYKASDISFSLNNNEKLGNVDIGIKIHYICKDIKTNESEDKRIELCEFTDSFVKERFLKLAE